MTKTIKIKIKFAHFSKEGPNGPEGFWDMTLCDEKDTTRKHISMHKVDFNIGNKLISCVKDLALVQAYRENLIELDTCMNEMTKLLEKMR